MNKRKTLTIVAAVVVLIAAAAFIGNRSAGMWGTAGYAPSNGVLPTVKVEGETLSTPAAQTGQATQERVVVYTASISLETSDTDGGLARIRALVEGYGGYVAGSSKSNYGAQATAEIDIRIPKDKFHAAVQEIETLGKVVDEHTNSEDITQQYIDLSARLDSLKQEEQSFQDLMLKANTVDEILRVETELARVRGEMDSLQGQLNYLKGSAEMSLITVQLTEPSPPFTPPGVDWYSTIEIAIRGLYTVIQGLIIIAVSLLPLVIIGAPIYYLYRRWKGKTKQ